MMIIRREVFLTTSEVQVPTLPPHMSTELWLVEWPLCQLYTVFHATLHGIPSRMQASYPTELC